MAENPSGPAEPLDVRRIHYLVRLMKHYDLTALDLIDGPVQIRLRRRGPDLDSTQAQAAAPPGRSGPATVPATASPVATAPRTDSSPAADMVAPKTIVIESTMVGTYYTSSAPDAPPYVSIGSVVHPDTIVGIIEAMKVFTEIPAGVSGTIVEILAKNGQAVEFSQPLFRVVPA
jgi:acetyl-CoA carboxylase biotin carboxyl carrier protein